MSKIRKGLESDYRDERWAARIEYVADHIKGWLLIGVFAIMVLAVAVLYVVQAIMFWGMGAGWLTIVALGVPLLWIGWMFLRRWSRATLNKAYIRRIEDGEEEPHPYLRGPKFERWN